MPNIEGVAVMNILIYCVQEPLRPVVLLYGYLILGVQIFVEFLVASYP